VQDALNSNEGTTFETPSKEKTILEPSEATTTILEPTKKEQPLISNQAEEQFTELKSVDGPPQNFVEGALKKERREEGWKKIKFRTFRLKMQKIHFY
jgi:hypothetical protein